MWKEWSTKERNGGKDVREVTEQGKDRRYELKKEG